MYAVAVRTMQAPTPPLLSIMDYALLHTHNTFCYCRTFSCVVCTILFSGCWGGLCLLLLLLQYGTCRHLVMTTVPSYEYACQGFSDTSLALGRPDVANTPAVRLPRVRVYS